MSGRGREEGRRSLYPSLRSLFEVLGFAPAPGPGGGGLSCETGFSPALYPPPRFWIGGSAFDLVISNLTPDELKVLDGFRLNEHGTAS